MAKLRKQSWHERPRLSRLANVLYPNLADAETKAEMERIAANEKKKPPHQTPLLSDAERGACSPLGGLAKRR
jgi:hypothetical protein